ncbi:FAD binding domain-containing protein [Solidesulfovibrio sp.]|uniref:FAD binding domain-containing protein n=1 Tax=Solidesulfovibrio sp. TaxID=2910990 RepID=UPI00262617BD|nr:FAD binding domain-containing protein [Solidesulfovibrio sp.]
MFDVRSYRKAASVGQALTLLAADPEARPMAGGTNALFKLRRGSEAFRSLVDIAGLPELPGIALDPDGGLRIGAGVTFRELAASPLVAEKARCLAEAALAMGGPQLRARATLGGNLCGGGHCAACRRCRYPRCPAAMVGADGPAPLLALDARAEIAGRAGKRLVPLGQFWTAPSRTAVARDELLLGVVIPAASLGAPGSGYVKYAMRAAMDTATFGCAALCRLDGGRIAGLRLACVMAGPTPRRLPKAEAVAPGRLPDAATFAAMAAAAAGEAAPRADWQGDVDFRLHIIRRQIEALLAAVARRAEDA